MIDDRRVSCFLKGRSAMMTRRELLQLGILSAGSLLLTPRGRVFASDLPPSPSLTPFRDPLLFPPSPHEVSPFSSPDCATFIGPGTRFFEIVEEERLVQFHSDLPPTRIWGYRDRNVSSWTFGPGPTFRVRAAQRCGEGVMVRMHNSLPAVSTGSGRLFTEFGVSETTTHFHGGHHEARSDGFPDNIEDFPKPVLVEPGEHYDYCFPMLPPGFFHGEPDPTERPSMMWYHDHLFDFTSQNVYKGLAGFYLVFDDLDTGDETTGLGLPSGAFDVPLVLQDKRFGRDGSLLFDPFNTDGFLGDTFVVNGTIRPFHHVKRRKYRVRFLNGSNARFYQIFLTDRSGRSFPFDMIATEGGLLARPIRGITSFRISSAERVEVVIDFSQFQEGSEIFIENRLEQVDGRGPKRLLSQGPKLLKFIVEGAVDDPSLVPDSLRPFEPISQAELARAPVRTFVFDRQEGNWAINGQPAFDLNRPAAEPRLNRGEIWRLINKSGGWSHPIHPHLDLMRVLRRNGKTPPLHERDGMGRKDTVVLGPNDEVDVFIKFRDFPGPFVFHCHNLEHEDHRMMARMDMIGADPSCPTIG